VPSDSLSAREVPVAEYHLISCAAVRLACSDGTRDLFSPWCQAVCDRALIVDANVDKVSKERCGDQVEGRCEVGHMIACFVYDNVPAVIVSSNKKRLGSLRENVIGLEAVNWAYVCFWYVGDASRGTLFLLDDAGPAAGRWQRDGLAAHVNIFPIMTEIHEPHSQ
jgi:hypothetical protein